VNPNWLDEGEGDRRSVQFFVDPLERGLGAILRCHETSRLQEAPDVFGVELVFNGRDDGKPTPERGVLPQCVAPKQDA
jgi:hypothetical protein